MSKNICSTSFAQPFFAHVCFAQVFLLNVCPRNLCFFAQCKSFCSNCGLEDIIFAPQTIFSSIFANHFALQGDFLLSWTFFAPNCLPALTLVNHFCSARVFVRQSKFFVTFCFAMRRFSFCNSFSPRRYFCSTLVSATLYLLRVGFFAQRLLCATVV